jgi:hypothetical protein
MFTMYNIFYLNSLQNNNMISQFYLLFFSDKKIGNLLEIFCSINSIDRIIPREHRMLYNCIF